MFLAKFRNMFICLLRRIDHYVFYSQSLIHFNEFQFEWREITNHFSHQCKWIFIFSEKISHEPYKMIWYWQWIQILNIEPTPGETPIGPDGQPIESAVPLQLGEDGQPIPSGDGVIAEAIQSVPEPIIIKKKTPPPFEFKLDLPPEGAEVPYVKNCEFWCRWPVCHLMCVLCGKCEEFCTEIIMSNGIRFGIRFTATTRTTREWGTKRGRSTTVGWRLKHRQFLFKWILSFVFRIQCISESFVWTKKKKIPQ